MSGGQTYDPVLVRRAIEQDEAELIELRAVIEFLQEQLDRHERRETRVETQLRVLRDLLPAGAAVKGDRE